MGWCPSEQKVEWMECTYCIPLRLFSVLEHLRCSKQLKEGNRHFYIFDSSNSMGGSKSVLHPKTSDMQRSLWEMERLQIWTLSLKLKKKNLLLLFPLRWKLDSSKCQHQINMNWEVFTSGQWWHWENWQKCDRGDYWLCQSMDLAKLHQLEQIIALTPFLLVLNEQASLEEFFFSSVFSLWHAPPWTFQRTTSEQKWKYCAGALNIWKIYVFDWKLWKRHFCRNSVENILFPAMLLLWHIFGGQPYSLRNRGARKCVGHKFGF